jgi:hypothetical protein
MCVEKPLAILTDVPENSPAPTRRCDVLYPAVDVDAIDRTEVVSMISGLDVQRSSVGRPDCGRIWTSMEFSVSDLTMTTTIEIIEIEFEPTARVPEERDLFPAR